jgi:transcription elongation GreA/GreB family factor
MTRQAHIRLKTELSALHSPPSIEVPDDFMDCHDDRIAAHLARRARIGQIHDLLANAAVGQDPDDDVIAEPGMVLTVRFDDTGEIETFLLGVRGAEDADIEVYSMQSPLGRAIAGARPGETAQLLGPQRNQPARHAAARRALRHARREHPYPPEDSRPRHGFAVISGDADQHPSQARPRHGAGGPLTTFEERKREI